MTWWMLAGGALTVVAGSVPLALRALRIAQREHYLAGSVTTFLSRWWRAVGVNAVLGTVTLAALGTAVAARFVPIPAPVHMLLVPVVALVAAVWPVGLPMRGVTGPLAWTDRLRRVAVVTGVLWVVVVAVIWVLAGGIVALVAAPILLGPIMDLALAVLAPVARRDQRRWIDRARGSLATVSPKVVAITGSYGKTTTKEYARLVLGASAPTLASPASFNNAMGLARTINEHLAAGTAWFIAEMGTYGPGEIRDLCEWIPPDIAAITAIGPVHLERFGSLDTTLAAKAEIAERAHTVVLNVDDPMLAELAERLASEGKRVIRTGTTTDADVAVVPHDDGWTVVVDGRQTAVLPRVAFPSNLAVAVGIGVAAGVPLDGLAEAFAAAETPAHRQTVARGPGGFWVIDDTFNSNPAGAAAALELLAATGSGRRVVVTPGMVELGPIQAEENRAFGLAAARVADDVVIVRRTNRTALRAGARQGPTNVRSAKTRDDAVAWVRSTLSGNDAVLYENDLPDHYP